MVRNLRITTNIRSRVGIRWHSVGGLLVIIMAASLVSVKLLMAVYATAGDLDPSFGNGGKAEGVSIIGAIAIQADGKLLALGRSQNANCQLSRFNLDGSLDPTFGMGGQVETNFGNFSTGAIAIQPNGRIVIAGTKNAFTWSPKIVLARYQTNGSLDSTFSEEGMVEIPHLTGIGRDLALQSDGKIVVAGAVVYQSQPYPINRSLIVRLNQDGTLDSSFATSGYMVTNIWGAQPNPAEGFSDLIIQGNGKILASSPGNNFYSKLVRFFANGERDMSFGSGGAFDSAQVESNAALALQPDGKIVIAVNSYMYSNYYGLLVRLSADGILDDTFGQGGKTVADPIASWSALGIQEDGRLVVAGGLNSNSSSHSFRLSRYQSDGSLDAGFGSGGTVTTGFSKPYSYALKMGLYADGRILVAGQTYTNGSDLQYVMARYLNDDGTPAPADVRVAGESISPRIVNPGGYVTYTIPVVNNGPGKAAHVTLTTQTPANTVFSSFSAPLGWVVYQKPALFSTGVISCSAYDLPAGATVNFTLTVRVGISVPPGTQISQASTVSSFMPDPVSTNNTATRTFTVQ